MDSRELILEALRILDIDQAGLAKRLRRGQPTVSRWLSGDAKPDYESCLRLAQITGMPAAVVLETVGLDPQLIPTNPGTPTREVDARRQVVRNQLDEWLNAVGPENESYFWDYLKTHGDTGVDLIKLVRTAVSESGDAAVNAAVSGRGKRGRKPRDGGNGRLTVRQHAGRGVLIADRPTTKQRLAA
jgi:transcriptional regulator with XRE-family HTH domain